MTPTRGRVDCGRGEMWRPQIYSIHESSVTPLVLDGSPPHYFISAAGLQDGKFHVPCFNVFLPESIG